MNNYKLCVIILVSIWLSVTIGISVAIWVTKSLLPLCFYIIPACMRVKID